MIHITLPIEPIARVVVNVSRSGAAPSAFDTGLLLIRDAAFTESRRLAEVSSSSGAAAQLAEWGFGPSSAPYAAAVKYFGASPSPFRLLLSCYPASETLPEAVSAVLDLNPAFYGIAFGQEEADERILALDAALSAMTRQLVAFVPVTGDPDAYHFAVGMATYQPGVDKEFADVFKRADEAMYLAKKRAKNHK